MAALISDLRTAIVAAGFVPSNRCFAAQMPPEDLAETPVVVLVSRQSRTSGHLLCLDEWTERNVRVTYQSFESCDVFDTRMRLLGTIIDEWLESAYSSGQIQYWTRGEDTAVNQNMDGQVVNGYSGTLVYDVCETTSGGE